MRTIAQTIAVAGIAAVGLIQTGAVAQGLFGSVEEKTSEHRSFTGANDLIVDNVRGFIEVTAYDGKTIEVDVAKTLSADSKDRLALAKRDVKLDVTQEGGLVRLLVDGESRNYSRRISNTGYSFTYDFKIRVPRAMRLELSTVNDSHITLNGTAGEFKVSNVNGPIDLRDVEGSGSVHTVNGGVKVTFARNPTGASEFKSVNGTLDVTFRAGLNANLLMKTMHGELLTDFPTTAMPVVAPVAERDGGKYVWKSNRMTGVRVGSGGPELRFETLNGDVLIKNRER